MLFPRFRHPEGTPSPRPHASGVLFCPKSAFRFCAILPPCPTHAAYISALCPFKNSSQ